MNTTIENPGHRIVIVGGGAGGLELATRLGDKYGRKGKAVVTLIDKNSTHVWKPKLHEIAAGRLDMSAHEVGYLAQAHWHGSCYVTGEMIGLDRERQEVRIAPYHDSEGNQVTSERVPGYDTLIVSVGSQSNDFGTPGVKQHALKLEDAADARRFHARMANAHVLAQAQTEPLRPEQLHVAIIGAGATGVELAAELHRTTREVVAYGMDRVDPDKDMKISLIEAAERVLPALPERLSKPTEKLLAKQAVDVHTSAKVSEVQADGVHLADGRMVPAELVVWPSDVNAADFLSQLGGLETNRINKLLVKATLQTTLDDNIFAIGDCAACPWPEKGGFVPPRAQAAHRQASHLYKQRQRSIAGEPVLKEYEYRDFGSLVSMGEYSTVGSMMDGLIGGTLMIEGLFAKPVYASLYKIDARTRLARGHQRDARHAGADDYTTHGTPCETALKWAARCRRGAQMIAKRASDMILANNRGTPSTTC